MIYFVFGYFIWYECVGEGAPQRDRRSKIKGIQKPTARKINRKKGSRNKQTIFSIRFDTNHNHSTVRIHP